MYRRPRFLKELHAVQEEMARQCDYDVDLYAEMIRQGNPPKHGPTRIIRGQRLRVPGRNPSDNQLSETDSTNLANGD